ncbi:hypothetical protein J2X65_005168 [Ancylobacter sp. 3268]|nr:hypothetical protein [Ancylobacter sp. 3268]
MAIGEVCRKAGISEATLYNWRKRYGGMMPSEVKRLRQLEEENAKLKRIVTDLSLNKTMLQDVLQKALRPAHKLALVHGGARRLQGVGAACLRDTPGRRIAHMYPSKRGT